VLLKIVMLAACTAASAFAGPRKTRLCCARHGRYSGMCQSHYVLEFPGGHDRSPIGAVYLSADGRQITDCKGARHAYPPRCPD
jgi:L-lysine 2,3-aminomutase